MAGEQESKAVVDLMSKSTDTITKLLEMLLHSAEDISGKIWDAAFDKSAKKIELKEGEVSVKDMRNFCKQNGENICITKDVSARNVSDILQKSKELGISVAVGKSPDGNSEYVNLYTKQGDAKAVEKILTEVIADKMQKNKGDFGTLKLENSADLTPLRNELIKAGVQADFIRKGKEITCFFENSDKEKVAEISDKIAQKHVEIDKYLVIKNHKVNDENDLENGVKNSIIIQNVLTGKQISYAYEDVLKMGENGLKAEISEHLVYDETSAVIAVDKIKSYISNEDLAKFEYDGTDVNFDFAREIHIKGESNLTGDYQLYQVRLKSSDENSFIIVKDDRAVKLLPPTSQNRSENIKILENFGVADMAVIGAILDKHKQANIAILSDLDKLKNVSINEKINVEIERIDKKNFTYKIGENEIEYSFSDRMKTVESIAMHVQADYFKATGVKLEFGECEKIAENIFENAQKQPVFHLDENAFAKEIFDESNMENAERTLNVERQVGGTFTVSFGEIINNYTLSPETKDGVIEQLCEDWGVDEETALAIYVQAEEQNPTFENASDGANMPDMGENSPDIPPMDFDEPEPEF